MLPQADLINALVADRAARCSSVSYPLPPRQPVRHTAAVLLRRFADHLERPRPGLVAAGR
jgi:hypothetical protein